MLMESDDWQSPFLDSWSELTTSDAIEEAESDDVLQQNMQGFGKTAQRIAGRLRYNPLETRSYIPQSINLETGRDDYLKRDYSADVLANEDIAGSVKETYLDIINQYPQLKMVEVSSMAGAESGGFIYWTTTSEDGDNARPHMLVEGDYSETGKTGDFIEEEYLASKITADRLAIEMGCDPVDIMSSPELQRDLLLLHELGHANSFLNRYLKPMLRHVDKKVGGDRDFNFSVAISKAAEEWGRRTEVTEDAKMLTPSSILNPGELGLCERRSDAYRKTVEKRLGLRFRANEMRGREDVIIEDARRYREQSEERVADDFAINYVLGHKEKYFGNIKTGVPVDVSETFDIDLSMQPGKYLMLKKRGEEGAEGGFLLNVPRLGEELILTGSADPDNRDNIRNYGVIERVVSDKKRGLTITIDGTEYLMTLPREGARKPIPRSVEELNREFGFEAGQELQLLSMYMPHREEDMYDSEEKYDDAVGRGGIIYGKLLDDITEGEPLHLAVETERRGTLEEWRSWPVDSVEQDWRTWRINTKVEDKVATYEVLPLPKIHKKIDYGKIKS